MTHSFPSIWVIPSECRLIFGFLRQVDDTCAIFTWAPARDGVSPTGCWWRLGRRDAAWMGRGSDATAISGCSIEAVVGCDPAQPYRRSELLTAGNVKSASNADNDSPTHSGCPEDFKKRWTRGSTALMLELLDQLHRELEAVHVPYSLYGATLLGQMRHGGFIPWETGQAQIAIRQSDVGAARHRLESPKRFLPGEEALTPDKRTPLRTWALSDTSLGFRLKFKGEKMEDLHRSFLVDIFVLGEAGGYVHAPEDLLHPETVALKPFHSRMFRVAESEMGKYMYDPCDNSVPS